TKAVITASAASALSVLKTAVQATPQFQPSIFHDSSSSGTIKPDALRSSHRPRKELLMVSREINSESLHEVFVPHWNVPNDTLLDDHDTSREFINHWPLPIWTEYCFSERRRLKIECEKQVDMLKAKDEEIKNLKAQLSLKEAEAMEAIHFRAQIAAVEATERVRADELTALKQKSAALQGEKYFLIGKITELQSLVTAKDLELKDFNTTVTSFKSRNDGLVDQ
ncbi:hypothetical protein Tco_1322693, partial [Tanacetum coccineum]